MTQAMGLLGRNMMIKRVLATALVCLLTATSFVTAAEFKDQREASMKKIGASMGALVAISKGEKEYDAETVKTSLTTISSTIKVFPDLFPAGSEQGDEQASPKIWENFDDFKTKANKLGSDADALLAQLPGDQAAVGAALKTLGEDCGACHQTYRLKKD
jgi:cytochrome c556